MFKRKKFMALCATTLAGISALGSFAPMATFADVTKNGDTVVTYEGAPKPAEWGLSVPANLELKDEPGAESMQPGDVYLAIKNCKLSIVKEDGTDYTDTQDRTFNLKGEVANEGYLVGTKDPTKKTALEAKIMDVGAPDEKDDEFNGYGISGADLKNQTIEATYKADGSQKAERYVKLYSFLRTDSSINKVGVKDLIEAGSGSLQTSVSWTATEKTS
ncbi:hypothetical protein [Lactococcus lactis]|uniref:hypothetical protein n=1 Tax=Lactococcus lactis TaxID=1358 RepID=UPI001F56074D|nr:hypothetical protein [Lactococcus lactis]